MDNQQEGSDIFIVAGLGQGTALGPHEGALIEPGVRVFLLLFSL